MNCDVGKVTERLENEEKEEKEKEKINEKVIFNKITEISPHFLLN